MHLFHVHERNVTDLGCSFCGKEFTSKQEVKNHILTDHKEKKYECSKCEASYRSEMSLQYHIESVHEKKKPHKCSICDASFAAKHALASHVKVVHDKLKLFSCSLCNHDFSRNYHLKTHMAQVHKTKQEIDLLFYIGLFLLCDAP